MSSIAGLKKTPHTCSEHLSTQPLTPLATPLSPTPAIQISKDEVCQVFQKQKRKKAPAQTVLNQSVWNPVLTSWPPSSQRSSTDHWNCTKSPSMLQTIHHHPHPKEIKNNRTTRLKACGSNVCGHEVIWKTGAGPPEGHHCTLAGYSSVCLQCEQWTMQSTWDSIMFCNI